MKYSESVKPISYLKAHASEVLRDVSSRQKTMVITQNGEAKAVLQDVRVFEQTQESLAFLKILSMSRISLEKGRYKPASQSFEAVRSRIRERK
ncbi:type II toxin-antitoxin system Phd/YefM family antitoxin [bacterium]|nr:type II toxin-antitoxin system Phd/YefM family antitoxin [bacterium]